MQERKENKDIEKTTLLFCIAMLLLGGCKKENVQSREQPMQSPKTGTLLQIEGTNVGDLEMIFLLQEEKWRK